MLCKPYTKTKDEKAPVIEKLGAFLFYVVFSPDDEIAINEKGAGKPAPAVSSKYVIWTPEMQARSWNKQLFQIPLVI